MEEHVLAADAEHGVIEIEAVEEAVVEVLVEFGVAEEFGVVLPEIFADGDEEAASSGAVVADNVLGLRAHEFDHEADDVAIIGRRAPLPISYSDALRLNLELAEDAVAITLDLKPEVEAELKAQAEAAGLSLAQFLRRELEAITPAAPVELPATPPDKQINGRRNSTNGSIATAHGGNSSPRTKSTELRCTMHDLSQR
jgi:hypothetical protein